MSDQRLYLVAHMQVDPAAVEEITPLFEQHAHACQQKPGSVFFYLIQDRDDPAKFSTMECWERMQDFQRHLDDEEHQRFQAKLQPRLAAEPEEHRCRLLVGA